MHVSCIQAGTLLARLGRPEVSNCIAGLEQYSYSYEEAGDQAAEMKRVYNSARLGECDLNHMASVAPRAIGLDAGHAMLVDESAIGNSNPVLQSVRVLSTYLHLDHELIDICSMVCFLPRIISQVRCTEDRLFPFSYL